MTASAGDLLVEKIAPRLRALVPKSVRSVGAEDGEELIQDAIAVAAQMLHSVERHGKKVTPGNITYYAMLHMKSGRRSQTASRADVMASATQLDHKSAVLSFEDEVGYDPELDAPITLGELLASEHEDPSLAGARNLDWDSFIGSRDYRYGVIARNLAQGETMRDAAKACGVKCSTLAQGKYRMADDLREFLGPDAIADSLLVPRWKASIAVGREKTACQAERRRR